MDIANISAALSTLSAYDAGSSVSPSSLAYAVGTEVLSQSLALSEELGTAMVQMMELSVNPGLGGNIDVYV